MIDEGLAARGEDVGVEGANISRPGGGEHSKPIAKIVDSLANRRRAEVAVAIFRAAGVVTQQDFDLERGHADTAQLASMNTAAKHPAKMASATDIAVTKSGPNSESTRESEIIPATKTSDPSAQNTGIAATHQRAT